MYLKSLHRSFYVKAGKHELYVKCFENGNWIKVSPEVGLDAEDRVVQIPLISSNLVLENWMNGISNRKINPLNHSRAVLSDFFVFEDTLRKIIKALKVKWSATTHSIVFQLDYKPKGDTTEVERRGIRDALEHCGGRAIYILDHEQILTDKQVDSIYLNVMSVSERQRKRFFKNPDSDKDIIAAMS